MDFCCNMMCFLENDGTTIEMMAVQHTKHVKKDKVDIV